jgi:hypothetical protein
MTLAEQWDTIHRINEVNKPRNLRLHGAYELGAKLTLSRIIQPDEKNRTDCEMCQFENFATMMATYGNAVLGAV